MGRTHTRTFGVYYHRKVSRHRQRARNNFWRRRQEIFRVKAPRIISRIFPFASAYSRVSPQFSKLPRELCDAIAACMSGLFEDSVRADVHNSKRNQSSCRDAAMALAYTVRSSAWNYPVAILSLWPLVPPFLSFPSVVTGRKQKENFIILVRLHKILVVLVKSSYATQRSFFLFITNDFMRVIKNLNCLIQFRYPELHSLR